MSSRSLHRPSLIAPGEEDVDAPRTLNLSAANHSIAGTPYLITQLRPFVPFTSCRPGEPFTTKAAWKGVISGIRALQRLRITGGVASGPMGALKSDLVVISAHEQGHVMVWSADTLHAIGSCTHFNNVTVQQMIVTKSYIFTRVERNMVNGKAGDDDEIYVWDLATMTLKTKLSGHEDRVTSMAVLDEDENVCVSGGLDKSILLWDVVHSAKPTGKLVGHNSSVTALLLSGHLLVSASADGFVKTWHIGSKTCIATMEGHQGIVTFLQWVKSYKESIRELQKQHAHDAPTDESNPSSPEAITPYGTFVGACSGGVVRSYNCSKHELTSSWQVKAHRAFTTDVCWDDNVYMSSSMAEPAINIYREGRSVNYKGHTGGEAGVRHLAIDRSHKVVIGGTDAGLLCFWSYKALMGRSELDTDTVTLIMSIQPHLGSISNLLLERSENSQWERLVSVSNDNSIFCMDFDVNRDSKAFHGVGLRCGAVAVPWSGSVVTASEQNIMVWDSDAMAKRPLPKKTFEGHSEPITALRYGGQLSRLVSGSTDKTVRCWDVLRVADNSSGSNVIEDSDSLPSGHEELYVPAWTIDLGMPVTCLSEVCANVVIAGCRRPNSKMGSVSIIDVSTGNEVVGAMPCAVFPVAATVLVQSDGSVLTDDQKAAAWVAPVHFTKAEPAPSPERSFGASVSGAVLPTPESTAPSAPVGPRNVYLIVQLRNGEIQIATINASGQGVNTVTPFRSVVPQQLEFFSGEAEDRIEMPTNYIATLDEKYDPPRATVLYASDPKTLRKDDVTPPSSTRPDITRTTTFATSLLSKVEVMAMVNQSGIYCAAGCDMGTGYLFNTAGEVVIKVRYDGAVIDVAAEELRPVRTRRCYYRLPGDNNTDPKQPNQRFPGCSFIRATPEARSFAFGYSDGMVQVYDLVQRRVCRRISAHGTLVRSVFVMPLTPRIVSLSKTGSLRFDTLYGRHVRHQGSTSSSAVTAAFTGAQ